MKSRKGVIKRTVLIFVAALFLLMSAGTISGSAQYNDSTFSEYANLAQNSSVPSLFRNDSVFASYKNYPPVISDGTEYVPLEIFYGLSGLKISFSEDSTNFYIQNKNTNKYISFSIPGNYAVTNNNTTVPDAAVKTLYGVYYVPLRTTCNTINIGWDTFNDTQNKIYVIKVYTVSGLSAKELIKINAPGIYAATEDKEQDSEKEDTETFGRKTLYLSFVGEGLKNANGLLNTLNTNKIKAAFFLTLEDIIKYPDTVRRIYTGGHTIGLTFTASDARLCEVGGLETEVALAQSALYDVLKTKTRLIYIKTESNKALYDNAAISDRISELGLRLIRLDTDARNSVLGGAAASERLTEEIKKLPQNSSVYIKMTIGDSARTVTGDLARLVSEQEGVSFSVLHEAITQ